MKRRDFLKAAIAAPLIAAVPWYVEKPIEAMVPQWLGFDLGKGPSYTYVARKVWFDSATRKFQYTEILPADFWAVPTGQDGSNG